MAHDSIAGAPPEPGLPQAGATVTDTQGRAARIVAVEAERIRVRTDSGAELLLAPELLHRREDGGFGVAFAFDAHAHDAGHAAAGEDRTVIPVWREELEVGKRSVETGGLRIHRTVQERQQVIDEPLLREELEIERVPVGTMLAPGQTPEVRQEGDTLVVPVLEEVLVVEKRMRLKEEIRIVRRRKEVRAPQTVTLRSGDVRIERFQAGSGAASAASSHPTDLAEERRSDMPNTLIGVYDDYADAQRALNELLTAGFAREDIRLSPSDQTALARRAALAANDLGDENAGRWNIGNFFRSLFGSDEHVSRHKDMYSEAVRRGSYLLTVYAGGEPQRDRARAILERHHPVDIDHRARDWEARGWTGYDSGSPPLSDEEVARERAANPSPPPSGVRVFEHGATAADDADFRNHWQTSYGHLGGRYEDYEPAYRYGSSLAGEDRYRNSDWNDIEPQARLQWETGNAGGPWDAARDAVRYGWEKMTK